MKYKEWLNEWLENYVKPSAKVRTYERYNQLIKCHILSYLGDYDLTQLNSMIIQKHITFLLNNGNVKNNQGLSPNTVNSVVSIIKNSIKTASLLRLISDSVITNIVKPKIVEKRIECFSLYEQKKIEHYILNSNKIKLYGIIICLYTGLRIGELLALKFSDIDLTKGIMSVTKSCFDGSRCRIIDTPKTNSSVRIIPIPKPIIALIKEIKRQTNCEFIVNDKDKPILIRSYQRSFELLLKRLNINHKGFHSLRHTFATRALECGMDVKTLSEILGHKNTNITLNRYVHSLMEHKKAMMNKLAKML